MTVLAAMGCLILKRWKAELDGFIKFRGRGKVVAKLVASDRVRVVGSLWINGRYRRLVGILYGKEGRRRVGSGGCAAMKGLLDRSYRNSAAG